MCVVKNAMNERVMSVVAQRERVLNTSGGRESTLAEDTNISERG